MQCAIGVVDSRQYCTPKFIGEFWGSAFLLRVLIADLNLPDLAKLSACNWKAERTPLNIYLCEAAESAAQAAVVDYGQAIKDLAASGIFPGDLLIKNFGVTRHGRVVFYDYDELCLLDECNFRIMPSSQTYEEEISAEPWFTVRESDIFPAEFERFLGLPGNWREVFLAHHADLFDPHFWQQHQACHRAGELIHIFPYDQNRRLSNRRAML